MKTLQIAVVCAGTALFQVAWHSFLSLNNEAARTFLRIYLAYDPKLGKGVAPVLDLLLPSIVVGAVVGFVSRDWSVRRVVVLDIAVAIFLVALLPAYAHVLSRNAVWWWPKQEGDQLLFFIGKLLQSVLVVGMLGYGGRLVGLYHEEDHD